jgi:N-acetylmuramoyl-L-alanine amidase/Domain of unknown function (DUF4214)
MPTYDITREQWGARAPRIQRKQAIFDHVEVHHTAVPSAATAKAKGYTATVLGIQKTHMDTQGWNDIFYNAIVTPDGTVYEGRADTEERAFRLCFVGNFEDEEPTPAQIGALHRAIAEVGGTTDTHTWRAAGTRYASSCPGDHMIAIVTALNQGTPNMSTDATRLYTAILNREPDAGGLAFWNGELKAGRRTYVDVAVEFLALRFAASDAADLAVAAALRADNTGRTDVAQVAAEARRVFYAELENLADLASLAKEAEPDA